MYCSLLTGGACRTRTMLIRGRLFVLAKNLFLSLELQVCFGGVLRRDYIAPMNIFIYRFLYFYA